MNNSAKKILIVDPDKHVVSVLSLKLKQKNFVVKTLFDTVNAIPIARDFMPDLIISEMLLPEISGIDFLKRIKMNPDLAEIPFIFLSGSKNVEDKIVAHEMGAEAYLVKPVFLKAILNRIEDFFEQQNFDKMLLKSDDKNNFFAGDLINISIVDLLEIVRENKKSGEIKLIFDNEVNYIWFRNGEIIRVEKANDADNSPKSGKKLFYEILSKLSGSFELKYKEIDVESNISETIDELIINATEWTDSFTSELSDFLAPDTIIFLNFPVFIKSISKLPDNISKIISNISRNGSSVKFIIESTELDKLKTIEYLKKLLEISVISTENNEEQFILPDLPEWFLEYCDKNGIELNLNKDNSQKPDTPKETEKKEETAPAPQSYTSDTLIPELSDDDDEKENSSVASIEEIEALSELNELKEDIEEFQETNELEEIEKIGEAEEIKEEKIEKAESQKQNSKKEEIKTESPEEQIQEKEVSQKPKEEKSVPTESSDMPVEEIDKEFLDSVYEDLDEESFEGVEDTKLKKGNLLLILVLLSFFIVLGLGGFYIYNYTSLFKTTVKTKKETKKKVENKKIVKKVKTEELSQKDSLTKEDQEFMKKDLKEMVDIANKESQSEKYKDAIKHYKLALLKSPTREILPTIYMNLAIAFYNDDNDKKALDAIERSLALNELPQGIELKASILEDLKRFDEAIDFYKSYLKNPKFKSKRRAWKKEIKRLLKEKAKIKK